VRGAPAADKTPAGPVRAGAPGDVAVGGAVHRLHLGTGSSHA